MTSQNAKQTPNASHHGGVGGGRLGIGTDLSGIHSAVRTQARKLSGPKRPLLCCPGVGPPRFSDTAQAFFPSLPFGRSFRPFIRFTGARDGIMAAAAASSLSVLPLAPRRPLPLRRAARNAEGGGASRPLRLARLRLRRGRPAAAAVAGDAELPLEEAEAAMRVAADDDSVTATVVSVLLTVAFVGLSILTLGVIYLAVQDFLQKREKEKFEKEEAEKQKEEARQKRAKSRKKRRNY
ncbi:uncharacterized protein LOC101762863 [Setaria italica]|nr:uncharacterized protein LOC101762863 [Setaria italica]